MKILRHPSNEVLDRLMAEMRTAGTTYASGSTGPGFHTLHRSRPVAATWEQAKDAVRTWRAHTGAGITVRPGSPPVEGLTVVQALPLGPISVVAACRVTVVYDADDEFGFTYTTLPIHPEVGEESFILRRDPAGSVVFHVSATSRPSELLVRLGGPVSSLIQRRVTDRYLRLDGLA